MENKLANSLKWSALGEIVSKLIAPITNIILARILMPEDFGVVSTINMIITFVDIFTDSGFSKYIIQADFDNDSIQKLYLNVAFWTNFVLSSSVWIFLFIFREPVANAVGNSGNSFAIIVAAVQIIISSFSSVQLAFQRRNFNFRLLFISRFLSTLIPFIITVPLAFILKSYWALIIGSIMLQVINAIFLTLTSSWKPQFQYSLQALQNMFSFSLWSLAEGVAYWLISWFDVFIIGKSFSTYYLGLYKNSINLVNSLMNIVKYAVMPVLFSTLSRIKHSTATFERVYFNLQEIASSLLIPLGIGVFLYRDFITNILFGEKWIESALITGVWAIATSFYAVYINFNGEAYKAKGLPKILFIYELTCLAIMVPICMLAIQFGFWTFVYSRSFMVVVQVIIGLFFMNKYLNFSIKKMLRNVYPSILASFVMIVISLVTRSMFHNILWEIMTIVFCIMSYFLSLYLISKNSLRLVYQLIKNSDQLVDLSDAS